MLFRSTAEVRCTVPDNKSHQPQAMLDQLWIFPLLGIAVGVLAGLLGVGGGLILVGALIWLLPLHGIGHDPAMHPALASSMARLVLTPARPDTRREGKEGVRPCIARGSPRKT